MNILITGIHGLIGPQLVDAFRKENCIYGLDLDTSIMEGVRCIFKYEDIKEVPDVDVVIHLAGKFIEAKDLSESLAYFEQNAGLTRKIFNWFTQSTAQSFIYFSTVKAAANYQNKDLPLTEEMKPTPFGVFGESKLLAERYIMDMWTYGKKVYVLRPAIIHGPGHLGTRNLKVMYEWVRKGFPFPFGNFECRRSFTSMDNLCFAVKQILELDIPGGIYNVVDDDSLQLSEVYEMMGYFLKKKVRLFRCNKRIIYFAARIGTRFHCSFNDHQYLKLSSDFVVSNEKLKKALGIQRFPVSIVDGLNKSIMSLKNDSESF